MLIRSMPAGKLRTVVHVDTDAPGHSLGFAWTRGQELVPRGGCADAGVIAQPESVGCVERDDGLCGEQAEAAVAVACGLG